MAIWLLSFWWLRARFQMRTTNRKATGLLSVRIRKPVSPLLRANGSIDWRPAPGQCWLRELVRHTAESTPWKGIQPAVWGFLTIWGGSGSRRQISRLFAYPDVRCSQTISWRRFSIFYTWPPGGLL